MSKGWIWLTIVVVLIAVVVSLTTGCTPSKPALEDATQGQRVQDSAWGRITHAPEENDATTEDTEAAEPRGKYRTGQVWQDCENRAYVKIVELLSPESPERTQITDLLDPAGFALDEDSSKWDSNPYVHILRLHDNKAESYRKKDFEKRFRYAPEGRQSQ